MSLLFPFHHIYIVQAQVWDANFNPRKHYSNNEIWWSKAMASNMWTTNNFILTCNASCYGKYDKCSWSPIYVALSHYLWIHGYQLQVHRFELGDYVYL
jgi:hypothetical protein